VREDLLLTPAALSRTWKLTMTSRYARNLKSSRRNSGAVVLRRHPFDDAMDDENLFQEVIKIKECATERVRSLFFF